MNSSYSFLPTFLPESGAEFLALNAMTAPMLHGARKIVRSRSITWWSHNDGWWCNFTAILFAKAQQPCQKIGGGKLLNYHKIGSRRVWREAISYMVAVNFTRESGRLKKEE